MKQEQLREAISDISVEITNQYKEISPVIGWSNWVDDESNITQISNPAWGIIEDGKSISESDMKVSPNRLKTVTVGALTKVSKSLLNKNDKLHDRIVRAFAISSARAISNIGYYGNPSDATMPTITSTGTTITTTSGVENIGELELIRLYQELDSTSLSGAVFEVSKQVRDNLILASANSDRISFDYRGRLYMCGIPVYINEDFIEGKIVAALLNPLDVFTRCNFFEDGIQSLSEINATAHEQTFLSVFDTCSVVDQKDHAIILKQVATPAKVSTRKVK